jgi:hypothetical protein
MDLIYSTQFLQGWGAGFLKELAVGQQCDNQAESDLDLEPWVGLGEYLLHNHYTGWQ